MYCVLCTRYSFSSFDHKGPFAYIEPLCSLCILWPLGTFCIYWSTRYPCMRWNNRYPHYTLDHQATFANLRLICTLFLAWTTKYLFFIYWTTLDQYVPFASLDHKLLMEQIFRSWSQCPLSGLQLLVIKEITQLYIPHCSVLFIFQHE